MKEKLCTISHRTACNQTKPFRVNFAFYEAIFIKKKKKLVFDEELERIIYRDTNLGVVILEYISMNIKVTFTLKEYLSFAKMGPKSVNKSDFVSKHTNAHLSQLDSSLSGRNKDNCWNV